MAKTKIGRTNMEKISVYQTVDGKTFEVKSEAVAHQRELDLVDAGFDVELMKANADDILAFLKPFRTVKPRKVKEAAAE